MTDKYFVCAKWFKDVDPNNPEIAFEEVDAYGHIPYNKDVKSHSLSLRLRLITGEFEAYRNFHDNNEEIAFKSKNLQDVLDFINSERRVFWKHGMDVWMECQHERPNKSHNCMVKK